MTKPPLTITPPPPPIPSLPLSQYRRPPPKKAKTMDEEPETLIRDAVEMDEKVVVATTDREVVAVLKDNDGLYNDLDSGCDTQVEC